MNPPTTATVRLNLCATCRYTLPSAVQLAFHASEGHETFTATLKRRVRKQGRGYAFQWATDWIIDKLSEKP